MATLVLTALGAVVGGPIGAAVGAGIGQTIDRATLFRPATRTGPRLTELAVQTSSYGSAIPQLFGMMRVAGTVIWATDLVESRNRQGGGKGQPTTETYSYAASFAVLLSARPILAVRRIWAEGKLLRGAAGDWKAATGFRLHLGGEDQAADPLIASAEGMLAPAHRGCAYAVFEGLQLADYGNRVPSLTFEVVADQGALSVGGIAMALADEVADAMDDEATVVVDGFAAAGSDVAGVLDTLATIGGAWWRPDGTGLAMCDRNGPVRDVVDAGVLATTGSGRAARHSRQVAAIETVPSSVSVAHYDPARDYQLGVQQARRPGPGHRVDRIELPAVLDAATAKSIAAAWLAQGEALRTTRTVRCTLAAVDVIPGNVVRIVGEDGLWRVREAALEAMAVTLTLVPLTPATLPGTAASGRVLGAPDAMIGATRTAAFEIPALGDVALAAPRLTVAACGTGAGWRRAALLYSLDGGASWIDAGATAAPAVMGTVEQVPAAAGGWLIDERSALTVRLEHAGMVMGDADFGQIDAGANLALVGGELIQFARAEPLGGDRWRLGSLRRGVRGTEAAIGTQAAGDRFVLVEPDAMRAIDLPVTAIGREVRVMAWGVGDGDAPVTTLVGMTGASVLPPPPVRLGATATVEGGLAIRWVRRSRTGWRWVDGVDAPLGEEREDYLVRIEGTSGGAIERRVAESALDVAAPELPIGMHRISVQQRGTLGLSPPAFIDI